MHLAIFLHSLCMGGAQRRTVSLANGLAVRGVRVDLVVVSDEGPLRAELAPDVRVTSLDVAPRRSLIRRRRKRGRQMYAAVRPLAKYLQRERPDVLLSAASHANAAALLGRRAARVPVALVVRASNHLSRSSWNFKRKPQVLKWVIARAIYRWADVVVAVSEGVAQDIASWTQVPRERITVIDNPVVSPDLPDKARAPVEHPWTAPGGPPLILGAGRLMPQKDFSLLIRAFARLRAQRPARLVILGEGEERPRLLALAQRLEVAQDVDLPGYVANPFAWMSRATLFALSSAWEGSPGALIEAMACGCPVVSTDCPSGPREILDRGAYGRLVPVGDDRALAAAMLSTLDAPPSPRKLRQRAQLYSVDRAVDRYLEVLSDVVRRHGRAPSPQTAEPRPA